MLTPFKKFASPIIGKFTRRNFLLETYTVLVVTFSTSVIGLWIFRDGPRAIFRHSVPLAGDGALAGLYVKMANQRTFASSLFNPVVHTDKLGWPEQLNFSAYPLGQSSDLFLLRLLRRIIGNGDVGTLIHVVSVLKVVPIALAVLLLARTLRMPRILSIVIAIAYSISSFNLIRAEGHFFLALTWSIPLGLTAIYLAFQTSICLDDGSLPRRDWKHYVKIPLLLLLVAFSGFYYILFLGMLTFAIIVPTVVSDLWSEFRSPTNTHNVKKAIKGSFQRISSLAYVLLILVIGLLYQTVPILIEVNKNIALTGIADRSPIESVVYAGNLDSFFFDSSSLFLRIIKRQDLLNFLSSRISWEGSQLGAISGVAAYLGIIFLFVAMAKRFFFESRKPAGIANVPIDPRFKFVTYLLVVAFVLYISSPLNFGISRVLPEIRAWGRMSVVITLLILCTLGLLISKIWERRLIAGILTLALLVIPMTEAYFFHQGRPVSVDLSNAAQGLSNSRANTLAAMRGIYAQKCPIFLAPVYPFPEFDRPDDSNGDYAELDLPLQDNGYFRWSYPAVKDTTNWSAFQPLISEQPPFPRASLRYQLSYAHALGACGAVIDRTLLTADEQTELTQIGATSTKACFENLPGESFQTSQRFASLSFSSKNCRMPVSSAIATFAKKNLAADILWRIDQPTGLKYVDKWEVFSGTSPIDIRLIKSKTTSTKSPIYSFLFTPAKGSVSLSTVKVCLRKTTDVTTTCQSITLDSKGQGSLTGDVSQLKTSLQKYEFTIAPESATQIENWGLVVGI